jgi:conserved domain protein
MQEQLTQSSFDGQRPDEQLIVLFRKHGIALVFSAVWKLLLSGLILFVVFKFFAQEFWLIAVILVVLIMISWGLYFMTWYYTFCIVTNQRLRYVQRAGLFKQTVLDLPLTSIQTVRYETTGMMMDMINSGDLIIDAVSGELTISEVKNIKQIYNLLQDLISKESKPTNETTQN